MTNDGVFLGLTQILSFDVKIRRELRTSPAPTEAVQAIREKRPPVYPPRRTA